MNDEYLEEKAAQYALGTLPEQELADFEERLKEDRELQDLVHSFQTVNELAASESKAMDVPFHLYSKIMAEVDRDGSDTVVSLQDPQAAARPSSLLRFVSWAGWAAAACFLVMLGLGSLNSEKASNADEVGALANADILLSELNRPGFEATSEAIAGIRERMGLDERMIELAEIAEAYWFSYDGNPRDGGKVGGGETQEISQGFTLFDNKYRIGFIGVENLPDSQEGKGFHVWAKTANSEPVRAGMLRSGEDSRGLFFFDLSEGEGAGQLDGAISFFVTEESEERPSEPSDLVVLSGI